MWARVGGGSAERAEGRSAGAARAGKRARRSGAQPGLDPEVSVALGEHMERFPPVEVTLPWLTPTGPKVTHRLVFTSSIGAAIWSQGFNDQAWKPALASAGIIPAPEKGERYAAAREHGMHALRHFYASVLLDAGENIKALSLYLGHSDPGFTLRVHTHLMPSSETRTRKAISGMYEAAGRARSQAA